MQCIEFWRLPIVFVFILIMFYCFSIIRPNKVVVRLRKVKMVVMLQHSVVVHTGAVEVTGEVSVVDSAVDSAVECIEVVPHVVVQPT